MRAHEADTAGGALPRVARSLLRAWLPLAERDEVLEELAAELAARRARDGRAAANAWLWRQVLGSLAPLVRRTFTRGWTGFEPASSRFRPGGPWMESFLMDLRYAARRLVSRPTYALLAVLTLALGVGGTAAAFGLVRGLLLSPLPYADEARVGQFWFPDSWSEAEFLHLSPDWPGFSSVALWHTRQLPLKARGDAPPELVPTVSASAGLFDVLGVKPALGRTFQAGDDRPGAAPAIVLGHGLFQQLGGSPSLVGGTVEVDGRQFTVVGVMPERFWFPNPTVKAWVAEPLDPEDGSGNWAVVARRAPGTDGPRLDAALEALATRLGERFQYPPAWDKTRAPAMTPIRELYFEPLEAPLLATLAAMLALLVIACANVAALTLGQVDSRATELAVRMALGADSRRMAQQQVAEALLLGLAAAAVGALFAAQGYRLLTEALPLGPLAPREGLDWSVFWAALVLAVLSSLAVAWLASRSLRKADPQRALATARTGGIGARGGRTEAVLVVGQVALAVLLTAGAALLVRSVMNLRAIDPGVDTHRAAVVDVVMESTVPEAERLRLLTSVEEALAALPGVETVGTTLHLPLRGSSQNWGITVEGRPDLPSSTTAVRLVTPGYFEAVGLKLVEGRLLEPFDREGSERVVVINRALAAKYFPGEAALGKRVGFGAGEFLRVVGIVEDASEAGLTDRAVPARYLPYAQLSEMMGTGHTLVLRTAPGRAPESLLDDARRTVLGLSSSVAVHRTTTLEAVLAEAIGPARQVMQVLMLLTALAVLLGAVGVYGVTTQFVRRRQRDLGIKIALGLTPARVVAEVVRRGGVLVALGGVLGVVAAVVLSRLLSSLLYGVTAADPVALAGATLALLAVGVAAAWIPAWRASRLDPAAVFREG